MQAESFGLGIANMDSWGQQLTLRNCTQGELGKTCFKTPSNSENLETGCGWKDGLGISTFFFFFAVRAAPKAYGGSQARGPVGAAAASLHHSHSNTGSKPPLRPTPQLTATLDP